MVSSGRNTAHSTPKRAWSTSGAGNMHRASTGSTRSTVRRVLEWQNLAHSTPYAGCLRQLLCPRFLLPTSTMPSLACCAQYSALLVPATQYTGYFLQVLYAHFVPRTSTMPSLVCCLQYSAFLVPSTPYNGAGALSKFPAVEVVHLLIGVLCAEFPYSGTAHAVLRVLLCI